MPNGLAEAILGDPLRGSAKSLRRFDREGGRHGAAASGGLFGASVDPTRPAPTRPDAAFWAAMRAFLR